MARSVFIDTNTYLSFFRLSNNDLNEIKKLLHGVKSKELTVWLTSQVLDEFDRNREGVIFDALQKFRDEQVPKSYPKLMHGYSEYGKLKKMAADFRALRENILRVAEKDARKRNLEADRLMEEVFKSAERIDCGDKILNSARERMDRGNPPGKNGSYGDAINWEALLEKVPKEDDLIIISGDSDFTTRLNPDKISRFLIGEWEVSHKGNLTLYKTLSEFFRVHYPDIKLQIEFEQNKFITALEESPSFASTHAAIAGLDPCESYTGSQKRRIIKAGMENDQVYSIGEDYDVKDFYCVFLDRFRSELSDAEKHHFGEYFAWTDPQEV
ncbi:MAG: PIN domain-containing protein [Cutibacterium granulosum]|uniref:PIN domain-containing protein n=1 Tax=Cutibacterium granulosum TaxID=33011 RepID=UPI00290EB662|nr:PIN domain-containing protein [Cutibacterium granulosum]MDU3820691.1 PIN domain-containing protein [Cutibacterium granulosum]